MKKIILVLIAICSFQISFGQNLDQATVNKIRVKLIGAEKLYEQGEYWDTLDKIKEIEAISKGMKSAKVQNLKVKSYLKSGDYDQSKKELNKLYNMNPDDSVLEDIASYESKIDKGIKEKKASKERARLAVIKRKEDARLAEIKRDKEKNERLEKFAKKYAFFKKYYNIETDNFLHTGKNGKKGLVSKNGNIIVPYEYDNRAFQFSGVIFEIHKGRYKYLLNVQSGQFVLKELEYIFERVKGVSWEIGTKSRKEGLINSSGNLITKTLYDRIGDWGKNGYAMVSNYTGRLNAYGLTIWDEGVIDANGNEIVPLGKFSSIMEFTEGLAAVMKDGKWGFIDENSNIIISPQYKKLGNGRKFENGKAHVSKNGKKYFYINKNGEKVK